MFILLYVIFTFLNVYKSLRKKKIGKNAKGMRPLEEQ